MVPIIIGFISLGTVGFIIWRVYTTSQEASREKIIYRILDKWHTTSQDEESQVWFLEDMGRQKRLPRCLEGTDLHDLEMVRSVLAAAIRQRKYSSPSNKKR